MVSGLIAIAAAGWSAYKLFDKRAAFWTMLLFAVNPWGVFYSQLIWNQTMAPGARRQARSGYLLR